MQVSAEVRWFYLGAVPEDLRTWFCQPALDFRHRAGGGRQRKDVYLLIPDTELSIKSRGGKKGLEVKGFLDVVSSQLHFGQVSVVPRLFCKWSSRDYPQWRFERLGRPRLSIRGVAQPADPRARRVEPAGGSRPSPPPPATH